MAFGDASGVTALLALSGIMTAVPLLFFAAAARRLRYSTLGLLQYIAPTMVFLTGVFLFGEPLSRTQLLSFGLLWIGLAIYSYSALRDEKNRRREAEALV